MRVEERDKARNMRRQGCSYGEIAKVIPVAKSTLNWWLKDIELTEQQKRRILQLEADGRHRAGVKGPWRNREKSLQRIRGILADAKREFPKRAADSVFITGLVLYWAEGAKTSGYFKFTNSDPRAISFMVTWLTRCIGIAKEKIAARVYVHRVYAECGFERYWVLVTGLPASQFHSPYFKPTPHRVKKNPSYMGCCSLSVYASELFWRVKGWHEEFVNHLGVQLPEELDQTIWADSRNSIPPAR